MFRWIHFSVNPYFGLFMFRSIQWVPRRLYLRSGGHPRAQWQSEVDVTPNEEIQNGQVLRTSWSIPEPIIRATSPIGTGWIDRMRIYRKMNWPKYRLTEKSIDRNMNWRKNDFMFYIYLGWVRFGWILIWIDLKL